MKERRTGYKTFLYSEKTKDIFEFVHEKLIELLRIILEVCEENGIKAFPYSGSLLGIIRDGGFIPWDDDIDLLMFRKDFELFHEKFSIKVPQNLIYTNNNDKLYTLRYREPLVCKDYFVDGIGVDFFILDSLEDDVKKRKKQIFLNKMMQGMLKTHPAWSHYSFKEKILVAGTKFLGMFLTKGAKQKLYRNVCDAKNENSEYIYISNAGFINMQIPLRREWYESNERYDLRGCPICLPKGIDEQLSLFFGDWRKPTPENKRYSVHVKIAERGNKENG